MKRWNRPTLLLVLACVGAAATGCGGRDEDGDEDGAGRGTITCDGAALTGMTDLPRGFPKLDGVTYVASETRGPTVVVTGYYDGSLEDAYEGYKDAFEGAGYDVLFDELEEHDSEVSYRAGDDTEGIVALRDACDDERISVHITNRPS